MCEGFGVEKMAWKTHIRFSNTMFSVVGITGSAAEPISP